MKEMLKERSHKPLLLAGLIVAGLGLVYLIFFEGTPGDRVARTALPPDSARRDVARAPTPMAPRPAERLPADSLPSTGRLEPLRHLPPPPETRQPTEIRSVFRPERASFAVEAQGAAIPYRVFSLFVMPDEDVSLEAVNLQQPNWARFVAEAGTLNPIAPAQWQWKAPSEEGIYPIRITDTSSQESITLNVFVLTPFNPRNTSLNGYQIGNYELTPLRGNPIFNPPTGFIEVTPENQDVLVSPHFTLGQFLCKQESGYPKYVLLREALLLKLERLLEAVNEEGFGVSTLHVMSAFRTPYYNQLIGNTTSYSRHLYGGAADVYVDADGDGYMDDLTGDGKVTVADARFMAQLVEAMSDEPWYRPLIGGLGIYSPAPHRGPFIHVDVRGQRVRW